MLSTKLGAVKRDDPPAVTPPPPPGPDLSTVSARTNLNETAFFFPHLTTDESGAVRMEFTMPEALTKWKFLGFAHDKALRAGFLDGETVTAKDLMVRPNPPRFLREGDVIEFTVKVSNQSADKQVGKVRLTFADARTTQSVDAALGLTDLDQAFDVGGFSQTVFDRLAHERVFHRNRKIAGRKIFWTGDGGGEGGGEQVAGAHAENLRWN